MSCFHLLAIGNRVATNTGIETTLQDPDFTSFGHLPRSGFTRLFGISIFNILRNGHCLMYFSTQVSQTYFITEFFFHILPFNIPGSTGLSENALGNPEYNKDFCSFKGAGKP